MIQTDNTRRVIESRSTVFSSRDVAIARSFLDIPNGSSSEERSSALELSASLAASVGVNIADVASLLTRLV